MRCLGKAAIATVALFSVSFLAVVGAQASERVKVSVAGAGPGAAAYVIWGGLAALVSQQSETVEMSNLTTRGAVEDIRLIEAGKAEFGLGVATLVLKAFNGQKPFKTKHTKLRGVGPGTVTMFHFATYKSSGITSLEQLQGKRVSLAQKGSNTHYMTDRVLEYAGLKVHRQYLNWNVAADAMKDGRLDAFSIPNPVPAPSILKAATAAPINLLPITGPVLSKMLQDSKAYFKISIPAGMYDGVDKAVPTVGYIAWTIVNADVPADVVYEVTRLNYSEKGRDFLPKVHKGWLSGFDVAPGLDQMSAIGLKLHPGAERYWREKGHKVPANIAN